MQVVRHDIEEIHRCFDFLDIKMLQIPVRCGKGDKALILCDVPRGPRSPFSVKYYVVCKIANRRRFRRSPLENQASKYLSRFLRDRGVLYSDQRTASNMTFRLVVKPTAGACNEPFYMSYNQQNLMSMLIDPEKHEMANHHSLGPGALKEKMGLLRMFTLASVCSMSTKSLASVSI